MRPPLAWWTAVALVVATAARAKAALPLRHVLLINSYHEGYEWTDSIVRGIRETLQRSPIPIDLDIEYLDERRHSEPQNLEAVAQYYKQKFVQTHFDAIVTSDDAAVRFLLKRRPELFNGVPAVFCGVNEYHGSSSYVSRDPHSRKWLAGVLETVDLDSTVAVALHFRPDTQTVVTVGETESAPEDAELDRAFPAIQIRRIVTGRVSLTELGEQLSALPANSAVVIGGFSRDRTGRTVSVEEGARFVSEHSSAPVYGLVRNVLGQGVVGGKLTDGYEQGRTAARMALSILRGASPEALGVKRESPNIYGFDYVQLRRWGIPMSAIPKGSVVINRQKSFYAVHPVWVWGGIFFVLAQALAIMMLLLQRRQRRRAERSLALHVEKLERSNYMLRQFAYVTAHDFQEPIRNVAIFTELLGRACGEKLESEERRVMGYALSGARRTYSMLRGLMDWVTAVDEAMESGTLTDSRAPLDKAIKARRCEIEEIRGAVTVEELPFVHVSEPHLFRVWDGLLANAIEYRGAERLQIDISAERMDGQWKFCVTDNGMGIPAAFQERIFGLFKRLHQTSESRNGMGLAICRRIVDHYGGRLWVESEEGCGSTFCFTIPDEKTVEAARKAANW